MVNTNAFSVIRTRTSSLNQLAPYLTLKSLFRDATFGCIGIWQWTKGSVIKFERSLLYRESRTMTKVHTNVKITTFVRTMKKGVEAAKKGTEKVLKAASEHPPGVELSRVPAPTGVTNPPPLPMPPTPTTPPPTPMSKPRFKPPTRLPQNQESFITKYERSHGITTSTSNNNNTSAVQKVVSKVVDTKPIDEKVPDGSATTKITEMIRTSVRATTTSVAPTIPATSFTNEVEVQEPFFIPPPPLIPPTSVAKSGLEPEVTHEKTKTFHAEIAEAAAKKLTKYELDKAAGIPSAIEHLEKTLATTTQEEQHRFKAFLKQRIDELLNEFKEVNHRDDKQELKVFCKTLEEFELEARSFLPKELTRDLIEFNKLFPASYIPQKEAEFALIKFLAKTTLKTTFTLEEQKQEHERYLEGQQLLETHGKHLEEKQFIEVLRRLKFIRNNDASYNKQVVREGEGFTLETNVYEFIAKNPPSSIIENSFYLEQSQVDEVFQNLNHGLYYVYISKYNIDNLDPNQDKLVESSDEIHMNVVTYYTDVSGNKMYMSLGQYTSNTDKSTVHIAPKQYINNDPHVGVTFKEQRFRPYVQLVKVPQNDVKEYVEATTFSHQTDVEGVNIQKNLLSAINANEDALRKNPVRPYHIFTQANMYEITIKYLQTLLEAKALEIVNGELKEKSLAVETIENKTEKGIKKRLKEEKEQKNAALLRQLSPEYKEMKIKLTKKNDKKPI